MFFSGILFRALTLSKRRNWLLPVLLPALLLWGLPISPHSMAEPIASAPPPTAASLRNVLLLSSYHPSFPTFFQQVDGIKKGLNDPNIELDIEFMDAKRCRSDDDIRNFRTHLLTKIKSLPKYQLIFGADDAAVEFLRGNAQDLFPDLPVVIFGLNDLAVAKELSKNRNITGLAEMLSIRETLEFMLLMKAATSETAPGESIIAITDTTRTGRACFNLINQEIITIEKAHPAFRGRCYTLDLANLTWEELKDKLREADIPGNKVLLLSAYRDSEDKYRNFDSSLELITENFHQPLFHLWKHGLGKGIFGGKMLDSTHHAEMAGAMASRILSGTPVSSIPIEMVSDNRFIFDHTQLVRFGISEQQLPPNSQIFNAPLSFYRQNPGFVVSTITVILGLIFLTTLMYFNIRSRQSTESELQTEKNFIEKSINSIPGIFYVLDAKGNLVRWNDNLSIFSCRSQNELCGMSVFNLHPESTHHLIQQTIDRILTGETVTLELSALRINGERPIYFHKATLVTIDNTPFIVGTAVNITDLRLAANQLRESEEKFRRIFEIIPDGYALIRESGEILLANPAAARLFGYDSPVELMGLNVEKEFYPDVTQRWELIDTLQKQGSVRDYSVTLSRKDRTCFIAEMDAWVFRNSRGDIFLEGIFRDITRRKEDEHRLLRMATVIDQVTEGVLITDAAGTINYVNPSFERISGYRSAELIGKSPSMLGCDALDRESGEYLWETIRQGNTWAGVFSNRRKDGAIYEIQTSISPIKNDEGVIINFVAVSHELTEEKRLEKLLYHSQKMHALGTLAGGIAHDFNNILGAITGFAELCIDEVQGETPVNLLKSILTAGHRAQEMIRQILSFSRMKETEKKPVMISQILSEVLLLMKPSLPAGITMEIMNNSDGTEKMILADHTQIQQVIMNICTNACHAMAKTGGSLVIILNSDTSGPYPMKSRRADDSKWIEITISDTGQGIARERIQRIFEPYYSTRANNGGTGLGLSVAHGIIKNHQGEITVESEPGQGTIFHIFLPLLGIQTEIAAPLEENALPAGREKILLIDDEVPLLEVCTKRLTKLGYEVIAHSDPFEALEYIKRDVDSINLILTDKTMPGMSGIDLVKEVRKRDNSLPVILCTGFIDPEESEGLTELRINEILLKPVDRHQLANTVRTVLDRA